MSLPAGTLPPWNALSFTRLHSNCALNTWASVHTKHPSLPTINSNTNFPKFKVITYPKKGRPRMPQLRFSFIPIQDSSSNPGGLVGSTQPRPARRLRQASPSQVSAHSPSRAWPSRGLSLHPSCMRLPNLQGVQPLRYPRYTYPLHGHARLPRLPQRNAVHAFVPQDKAVQGQPRQLRRLTVTGRNTSPCSMCNEVQSCSSISLNPFYPINGQRPSFDLNRTAVSLGTAPILPGNRACPLLSLGDGSTPRSQ